MNRAAVTRPRGGRRCKSPRRLDDLRLEGLDMSAVDTSDRDRDPARPSAADLTRTIRVEQDGTVQRLLPRVVPVPALTPQQGGAVLLLYDVTDWSASTKCARSSWRWRRMSSRRRSRRCG